MTMTIGWLCRAAANGGACLRWLRIGTLEGRFKDSLFHDTDVFVHFSDERVTKSRVN